MLTRATRLVRTLKLGISRLATLCCPKSRVGYIGFHKRGNLGDDAMFEAAIRLLDRVELITVGSIWQEQQLSRLGLGGSRYFRAVILGGGTLIGPTYLDGVAALIADRVPMFTLGTGAGSSGISERNEVSLKEWVSLLRNFQGVGVRGPRSQKALESIGMQAACVVGDLALGLREPDKMPCPATRRFGLNLVAPSRWEQGTNFARNIDGLGGTVRSLLAAGWEVVPLALATTDASFLERFLERNGIRIGSIQPIRSSEVFQNAVQPCSFTVGTRLHSAVFSCQAGVPPLMLGYRAKCLDFMESMGLEALSCSLVDDDFGAIRQKLDKLMHEATTLRASIPTRVSAWQRELRTYSKGITDFVSSHNGTSK